MSKFSTTFLSTVILPEKAYNGGAKMDLAWNIIMARVRGDESDKPIRHIVIKRSERDDGSQNDGRKGS